MSTHLSARLAWQDRSWDGRVCDSPHLNSSCIVRQHIRDRRDGQKERAVAGTLFGDGRIDAPAIERTAQRRILGA